jgi:hypothetical protein
VVSAVIDDARPADPGPYLRAVDPDLAEARFVERVFHRVVWVADVVLHLEPGNLRRKSREVVWASGSLSPIDIKCSPVAVKPDFSMLTIVASASSDDYLSSHVFSCMKL